MKLTIGKIASLTISILGTAYFGNKVYESIKDITSKEKEVEITTTETTEETKSE